LSKITNALPALTGHTFVSKPFYEYSIKCAQRSNFAFSVESGFVVPPIGFMNATAASHAVSQFTVTVFLLSSHAINFNYNFQLTVPR